MRFWLTVCLLLTLAAPAAALDHRLGEQVLAEINLARTDPHAYAGFIRQFRSQFRGKYYLQPGDTTRIQTTEGVPAVDEAIIYLSRLKPLPPLAWSDGLAAAAAELANEQERSGATGHNGRKSHGMRERIERHGKWAGVIGENIGYGPDGARNMVIQLIVDDGVPGRGHRVNTFSGDYRTAGVTCGTHPGFGSMCVIDFAGGFKER
ncbi:MAG: CAP domain-containing protein [Desulfuromonadaceae bacterium]|nr:CAP domain-containing protein [Desulfuromonadaceae bacterium]MDD2848496.1 CAP domain-containing protein [Desulfuromonadaceae bacterium]MDD4129875.1 CAP domain-containing protein [Desulfuromonadaceae bacterium]